LYRGAGSTPLAARSATYENLAMRQDRLVCGSNRSVQRSKTSNPMHRRIDIVHPPNPQLISSCTSIPYPREVPYWASVVQSHTNQVETLDFSLG
jgi:hypothetical protein